MNCVVPGSACSAYRGPRRPESPGSGPDVKYQMEASAMITATTTKLMTVSWNIAYGKKGFPRRWTSSL